VFRVVFVGSRGGRLAALARLCYTHLRSRARCLAICQFIVRDDQGASHMVIERSRSIWCCALPGRLGIEQLRDDDNPFVEGFPHRHHAFLTAVLAFIGSCSDGSVFRRCRDQGIILDMLQQMSWWEPMAAQSRSAGELSTDWDLSWQVLPLMFGAPNPRGAALNILAWPIRGPRHLAGVRLLATSRRLFHGVGTLSQTLGTTAWRSPLGCSRD